jgi:hypothetical protein
MRECNDAADVLTSRGFFRSLQNLSRGRLEMLSPNTLAEGVNATDRSLRSLEEDVQMSKGETGKLSFFSHPARPGRNGAAGCPQTRLQRMTSESRDFVLWSHAVSLGRGGDGFGEG